jgi:hypothetical protein
MQPRRQEYPAQRGEPPDLGFMADDGAPTVFGGVDRERAVGLEPRGFRDECEQTRPRRSHDGAEELDRVRRTSMGGRRAFLFILEFLLLVFIQGLQIGLVPGHHNVSTGE